MTEDEKLEFKFFALLEGSASKLNLSRWDDFPEEQDLTVSDWLVKKGFGKSEHIKGLARALTGALVGRDPDDVGIHYLLDYIKSGRGLTSLMAEDAGGAQFQWIRQGRHN
jgi:monoamine oxidase